ncbi:MAG: osmotically inducible protein C [Bacteroidetes bacterium HGW-Bacteroidetes-13]|nr:MAG: osmotically inducible protein C [Bacteroidetes bacterium HGW-Bacteroidetes-13]
MSNLTFSVSGQSLSQTQLNARTRDFNILVDEPESFGGRNEAPSPVEYILAGLAGCINVVAHLVADELQIKVSNLCIDVSGTLNTDKLLGKFTLERAGFLSIFVNIKAVTDASDEKLTKWLSIIETRCPVKDTLGASTPISLSLKRKVLEKYCV